MKRRTLKNRVNQINRRYIRTCGGALAEAKAKMDKEVSEGIDAKKIWSDLTSQVASARSNYEKENKEANAAKAAYSAAQKAEAQNKARVTKPVKTKAVKTVNPAAAERKAAAEAAAAARKAAAEATAAEKKAIAKNKSQKKANKAADKRAAASGKSAFTDSDAYRDMSESHASSGAAALRNVSITPNQVQQVFGIGP